MTDHRQTNGDESLAAPERFTRALADLAPPAIVVPAAVDDAILREARNRLQLAAPGVASAEPSAWELVRAWLSRAVKTVPFQRPRRVSWAAAAAVVLLAGWLAQRSFSPRSSVPAADFNRDGRVDILDALALAQEVERRTPLTRALDFNRDGVVDRRDADAIAMRAVSLTPGEPL